MRLQAVAVTLSLTVALAYYVYVPLPHAIQEPWKLMLLDATFRTTRHLVRGWGGAEVGDCRCEVVDGLQQVHLQPRWL